MKKITNEIVDCVLKSRLIMRLGNYDGNQTQILWKCLKSTCNYEWKARPAHILNRGDGCPKCSHSIKLTNKDVDDRILNRNIQRLDDYKNNFYKLKFKCLNENCNFEWFAKPNDIFNGKGCPKCAGNMPLNNLEVDRRLKNSNIRRVDNYLNSTTKIMFKCLKEDCNYEWAAVPNNILNNESGCPNCSFGINEKIVLELLLNNNINFYHHKYINQIINNYTGRIFIVDFYLQDYNIIIEYNGRQHYQPVRFGSISKEEAQANFEKQKIRDQNLENICIENAIKIIWIDGRKYHRKYLATYIADELIPKIKAKGYKGKFIIPLPYPKVVE